MFMLKIPPVSHKEREISPNTNTQAGRREEEEEEERCQWQSFVTTERKKKKKGEI